MTTDIVIWTVFHNDYLYPTVVTQLLPRTSREVDFPPSFCLPSRPQNMKETVDSSLNRTNASASKPSELDSGWTDGHSGKADEAGKKCFTDFNSPRCADVSLSEAGFYYFILIPQLVENPILDSFLKVKVKTLVNFFIICTLA